jgi:hypothetical protein
MSSLEEHSTYCIIVTHPAARPPLTSTQSGIRPTVVLVFSHPDEPGADAELAKGTEDIFFSKWANDAAANMRHTFAAALNISSNHFVLNCNRSQAPAMVALRELLCGLHKLVVDNAEQVPKVCNVAMEVLPQLRKSHGGLAPVDELKKAIIVKMSDAAAALSDAETFEAVLRYMHNIGEIIWFGESDVTKDVVVVDPAWLCWDVIGRVLAPPEWEGSLRLERGNGLMIAAEFKAMTGFEDVKAIAVLGMLEALRLCIQLPNGSDAGDSAKGDADPTAGEQDGMPFSDLHLSPSETRYLFPATRKQQLPLKDLWRCDHFPVVCGRRVVCMDAIGLLTAGFYPSLQVQLYLKFGEAYKVALFGHQTSLVCRSAGVKLAAVVLLSEDQRAVDVWVCCGETDKEKSLASAWLTCVLECIEETRSRSCPGTVVQTLCVDPAALRSLVNSTPLPPVTEDAADRLIEMVSSGSLQPSASVLLTRQGSAGHAPEYAVVSDLFPFGELCRPAAQVSIKLSCISLNFVLQVLGSFYLY